MMATGIQFLLTAWLLALLPQAALAADANTEQKPVAKTTDEIGRVFTTRKQRDDIDANRVSNRRRIVDGQERKLTVNGVVKTAEKAPRVWVNGRSEHRGTSVGEIDVLVRPHSGTDQVYLYLLELEEEISLQPGQSYSREKRTTSEAFEQGLAPLRPHTDTTPSQPPPPAPEPDTSEPAGDGPVP